jgi:hypothetical protein
MEIPEGYCQCGCGKRTKPYINNHKKRGYVKGEHPAYLPGHWNKAVKKGRVIEHAEKNGYGSVENMLRELLKKHKRYCDIAAEIGATESCISQYIRKYQLNKREGNKRITNAKKREAWNKKHGTDYQNTREWLAALYEQYGGSKAASKSGCYVSYVHQCAKEQRRIDGKSNVKHVGMSDYRPSNLQSPWTNPDKAPCSECNFKWRDKNQPGCAKCPLPDEYVQLVEARYYPGVKAPGQAPVYYNAKGRAHNYHDWGVK